MAKASGKNNNGDDTRSGGGSVNSAHGIIYLSPIQAGRLGLVLNTFTNAAWDQGEFSLT